MNKNTPHNETQKTPVALKCVVSLFVGVVLYSSAPAADKSPAVYEAAVGKITIEVDPRVELISIVCRLAGYPEYNDGTLRPYVKAVEKHFGDFDGHPAIKTPHLDRLARDVHGRSHDTVG